MKKREGRKMKFTSRKEAFCKRLTTREREKKKKAGRKNLGRKLRRGDNASAEVSRLSAGCTVRSVGLPVLTAVFEICGWEVGWEGSTRYLIEIVSANCCFVPGFDTPVGWQGRSRCQSCRWQVLCAF